MATHYGTKQVMVEHEATWIRCDGCGRNTEAVDRADLIPMVGWFNLTHHDGPMRTLWVKHFCSRECLQREVLTGLRPPETPDGQ